MDENKEDVNKTIFKIPKPTATSTINRNRKRYKQPFAMEDSLGILSLNSINLSDISNVKNETDDSLCILRSKSPANIVTGLPSKYLRPLLDTPNTCNNKFPNDSTISDSDLLHTPTNTSTPRNSIEVNSLRESMAQLSYKISKGDVSTDTFSNELQKALDLTRPSLSKDASSHFATGEEATNLLRKDELSWRKWNEFPIQDDMSIQNISHNLSLGEFFLKKSDLSDLGCSKSPTKDKKPEPLISFIDEPSVSEERPTENESLSVTAIQRLLAEKSTTEIVGYLSRPYSKPSSINTTNKLSDSPVSQNSSFSPLPMSKNSSYTTDPSDNEAINSIVNTESTQHTLKLPDLRPKSQVSNSGSTSRASSALSNLPNGKLPIETSDVDLIWGCVKVDKCVTRDFLLRNTSSKRIAIQATISGREYKIRKDNRSDSEMFSSTKIMMHPYETKNISVSFIPTKIDVTSKNTTSYNCGGEVLIAVYNLFCKGVNTSVANLEHIFVLIAVNGIKILLGNIYFPPQSSLEIYYAFCTSFEEDLLITCDKIVITGDFNLSNVKWKNDDHGVKFNYGEDILDHLGSYSTESEIIQKFIGAAVESISFTPLDPNHQQHTKQYIRLYGYGGLNKIALEDVSKDTNNKFWLMLGKLDNNRTIIKSFNIRNSGQLPSFIYLYFKPKESFKISVSPNFFTLIPQENKEVMITYKRSSEDHRSLQKSLNVADIGSLIVTSGAEATRGRIRRLCRKMEECGDIVEPLAHALREKVFGEIMPADLRKFREQVSSFKKVLKLLTHDEVGLTLEKDLDQTVIPQYMDDSEMFQTLLQDSLEMNDTIIHSSITLEPPAIFLNPPEKTKDFLFLKSDSNKCINFQVRSDPEGLEVKPEEGSISPGQSLMLRIVLPQEYRNQQFKVFVHTGTEVLEAVVKIIID